MTVQDPAQQRSLSVSQLLVRAVLATLGVVAALAAFRWLGPGVVATKSGGVAGAMSLVAPLSAVALVLVLRRPALGLFAAVVVGAIALHGPVDGVVSAARDIFLPTVTNTDTLLILTFTASMLGMVQVCMAGGGFADLARKIAAKAGSDPDGPARRTRLSAWLLGLAIFFDDYANAIVVGSSIRPLADQTGVSRAKLAYIVDATSASVAGVAIVSTWVGMEVGLLQDRIGYFEGVANAGYGVFLELIPYRFYCLLTILFAFFIAWTGRDYGPMRAAERAAKVRPELANVQGAGGQWFDAMGPVLLVLVSVLTLDTWLGWDKADSLLARFIAGADANGLKVLAVAGIIGSAFAVGLSVVRGLLSVGAATRAFGHGVAVTMPILVILVCAMAIREVCDQAGTPAYLSAMLGSTDGVWMPVAAFLVSAVVAFLTGSSWATMGILLPIVVPLAARDAGPDAIWLLASTAAVLDGSIFGDHCSPISDTTVMSSAAAGCPHDEHVLTQLPYALTVMAHASLFGYIGASLLQLPPTWVLPLAALSMYVVVRIAGRPKWSLAGVSIGS